MKSPLSRDQYRAILGADRTWSVIDVDTEMAYRVQGVPMAELTEDTAIALAEILNALASKDRTIH
jgi:hypothetical protein